MAFIKSITARPVRAGGAGAPGAVAGYLTGPRGEGAGARLAGIAEYLERGRAGQGAERLVAHAHSDTIPTDDPRAWVDRMMATKRLWGKTTGVPYYHFVISPDPKDGVSPEGLVEMGREFMDERFPGTEWFLAVHDDNANRIPHAHIVMNSVMPDTGRKVHRSRAALAEEANAVQDLCRRHGLSQLPHVERDGRGGCRPVEGPQARERGRAEGRQASRRGMAERHMVARGARSWVADIRRRVDGAAEASETWEGFVTALDLAGVRVERGRRGITFAVDGWEGQGARRVRDATLGEAYTEEGIRARLSCDFDSATGVASPWRPHAHVPGGGELVRGMAERGRERREAMRPGSADLYSLEGILSRPTRFMARMSSLDRLSEALEVVSAGGYRDARELAAAAQGARETVGRLEGRAGELARLESRAQALCALAGRLESQRRELEAIERRRWPTREERVRARELRRRVADGEALVERDLSRARGIIAAAGLAGATAARRSRAVLDAMAAGRAEAERELAEARGRRDALERAAGAVSYMAGRPVSQLEQAGAARRMGGAPTQAGARVPDYAVARGRARERVEAMTEADLERLADRLEREARAYEEGLAEVADEGATRPRPAVPPDAPAERRARADDGRPEDARQGRGGWQPDDPRGGCPRHDGPRRGGR